MTVNIAFQDDLLGQIDQLARTESRSRSELIRNAAKMYVERQLKWKRIFSRGETIAAENTFNEADVLTEIKKHRAE
ncbi:MAG: ribbon-helix-helix domain-containing protein [Bacteroidales bacterium]|jgi:metal-responsive CopG/Arc/MetJ family transcriptional regulator|nr:ribbon-helix-helix domain-containing protein [Bacteroidales bacterium]